jgi:hypothetical protein
MSKFGEGEPALAGLPLQAVVMLLRNTIPRNFLCNMILDHPQAVAALTAA